MIWSEETMIVLRQLLDEGKSATEIGAIFKISRNAVIGKVHRTPGLRLNGYTPRPKNDKMIERQREAKHRTRRRVVIEPAPPLEPLIDAIGTTMIDLGKFECRWAINDAAKHEEHLFCGRETGGGVYCAHHQSRVFSKIKHKATGFGNLMSFRHSPQAA